MSTYIWHGRMFGDPDLERAVRDSLTADRVLEVFALTRGFEDIVEYLGGFYAEVPETVEALGVDPVSEGAGLGILTWYSDNGGEDIVSPIWQEVYETAMHGTSADLFAITGIRTLSSKPKGAA